MTIKDFSTLLKKHLENIRNVFSQNTSPIAREYTYELAYKELNDAFESLFNKEGPTDEKDTEMDQKSNKKKSSKN